MTGFWTEMETSGELFSEQHLFVDIKLIDADLKFARGFYTAAEADRWFYALKRDTRWRQDEIKVWGKTHLQPRLTAWYGDPGRAYSYSGITLQPLPWTPELLQIKSSVEDAADMDFNSVLINLYRDQQDSVGWHSDNEPELGKNPVIASLSLGEARTFKLKHKSNKQQKPLMLDLTHGSLLIMSGSTQECWLHAVEKETSARQARINLTFRRIKT
jgi:alkylated DNA repair dioxygenase AlkB